MEAMIEKLSEVLITYGWAGLIVIVLVGLGIGFLFRYIYKKDKKTSAALNDGFKQMSEMLKEQNTTLINTIINQNKDAESHRIDSESRMYDLFSKMLIDKQTTEKEHHINNLEHRLIISKDINNKLWGILTKCNADRIAIAEFHNSKENMNGLSFLWYDIQYEAVDNDSIPQRIYNRKDVQVSTVIPIINDLKESEDGIIIYRGEDIENIFQKSSILYSYIVNELKATDIIIAGLYNDKNRLIGFMSIEFINKKMIDDIINKTEIISQANSISDLLKYDEK